MGKIIAAFVVLAALGGGVYYMNASGHQKVNEAVRQWTEWTPEQIAQHPEEYLNFCEDQCKKALTDLQARDIAVAQMEASLKDKLTTSMHATDVGKPVLVDLKTRYRQADTGNAFPVSWEGKDRSREWLEQSILQLRAEVNSEHDLQAELTKGLQQIEQLKLKLPEAKSSAKRQLAWIDTHREILKLNKITSDLQEQMRSMGAAVKVVVDTARSDDDMPSLRNMAAQTPAVDRAEFSKAMAEQ